VISAQLFATFIAMSGLSRSLASWVVGLNLSAIGVVILIMVLYFVLGTAMDTLTMVLLTLPFFLPLLNVMHIDLIWFGVLVIIQMELSQITPPVGLNLFVVATMVKERGISLGTVFRGVMPFCYTMLVFNALIIAFPQLAMFLVNQMK
jgi:TRAP-type C4-dicarboxylate transport system permease large subunit